ncbi:DNA damage-induced apoptosis suppressor protein [Saimiri boliviensis]|uniref:DNA damage-induced apoptosis suppressor protein n=1 Tax=Saimiri boliviensis TaxID=27679 RepID=UPI00027FA5AF|nr:DNA damage-induced apoptosis suppressor protein [Saimiri boliviensis boliviensis]
MNRRRKFLLASVLALQNSSFIYPSCQKCLSRIIVVSKRSNCPKCGSAGESGNANYRYKLSLKVAESNKLYVITVFGSCLDTFFGLTATGLHRYIQDPNKIPETLDNDTTQDLLTKAVETCFVGQSFIFGVTNFENQSGQGSEANNYLQQCSVYKRKPKALVACQIVLPDPGVAGFTVFDYFHQLLQAFNFRKLHCDSQSPNSNLLALDHSSSDLSSIYTPDSTSYFFKSCSKDTFSKFWLPSLEFSSIVSQLTDDDFSASEQDKAFGTLCQNRKSISIAEATGFNSCHDPIQDSWSLVSYMDKKSTAEKLGKLGLQAKELSTVPSSHHETGVNDSLKMQEPLESSNADSFHSPVEIKNGSQHEPPCFQHHGIDTPTSLQKRSACCSPSLLRLEETASNSKDCDPEIWDDLPFSESLNKFLAVLESEIAITQADVSSSKHHVDNDISKFHADNSMLSVTPQRTTGALHTPPIVLRSSQAIVKANSGKGNFFFNCKVNLSPSVEKESQPDNKVEAVSVNHNGRDMSEYFLPKPSALFSSSKYSETTVTLKKTIRISPHSDEILLRPITSESDHSSLNNKYLNGRGEKLLSEMNEKLTTLCCRKYNDVSDLCKLENKQYYRWPKNQDDSFTICRKLTYPLETLCSNPNRNTNTLKDIPCGHITNSLTQSNSIGHEGSYDASADLFDDIAKEMDIATEITKKSQDSLLQWGMSLPESHHSDSDFSLRSLSEDFIQPSQKLSLQNPSDSRHSRTSSPTPHFQSDSEYNFENSQDFVPCSQSTPISGFHQTRIHGINRAFKKIPVFYSDLDANYEKIRIFPENDKQQASPSCPKYIKTPSQKIRSPVISGISQTEVFNHHPLAKCRETDSDEWVPPTTQKIFPSDMLGFQVIGLGRSLAAHHFPDQQDLARKKLKHIRQGTKRGLIKKKLKNVLEAIVIKENTPKYNCKRSSWISKCPDVQVLETPQLHPILGLDSCSEVKRCLPFSEKGSPSVCETKSAWSPELFS